MPKENNICEQCTTSFQRYKRIIASMRFCSLVCWYKWTREHAEVRFWPKVDKNGPLPPENTLVLCPKTPCWIWLGAQNQAGYGNFGITEGFKKYKSTRAHIFSYELARGKIPNDLELDHLCRRPQCVNPFHLEVVTRQVNNNRSGSLSAQRSRQKTCSLGHKFSLIRRSRNKWRRRCLICLKEYEQRKYEQRKRKKKTHADKRTG